MDNEKKRMQGFEFSYLATEHAEQTIELLLILWRLVYRQLFTPTCSNHCSNDEAMTYDKACGHKLNTCISVSMYWVRPEMSCMWGYGHGWIPDYIRSCAMITGLTLKT